LLFLLRDDRVLRDHTTTTQSWWWALWQQLIRTLKHSSLQKVWTAVDITQPPLAW